MSNQRVVVLTGEELRHGEAFVRAAASVEAEPSTREALEHTPVGSFIRKLTAALEHPGGITDEQRDAAINAAHDTMLFKTGLPDDFDSAKLIAEASIAALLPGDGEQ